jgi:hypothetical protein
MKPIVAQIDELTKFADHASQQNAMWLFIATLGALGIIIIVIWRWIVADREKLGDRLTAVTDRHIESCERLGAVVQANTAVLQRVEKKL